MQGIIEQVRAGSIPAELETKTVWMTWSIGAGAMLPSVTAILLAGARRDNFVEDVCGWVTWSEDNFGISGGYRDHLRKIGDLLLDMKGNEKVFGRLFTLAHDKLLSIARLKRADVEKFLRAYEVEGMSRDEVRDAVGRCLGEAVKEKSGGAGKYQPGLWDSIDALAGYSEADFEELAEREDFTTEKAGKLIYSGIGLLDSSLKYLERAGHDDVATLTCYESALRTQADRVRKIRENAASMMMQAG